jgi:hypothetical protein
MMRLLEEIGRLLARVSAKRRRGDSDDAALESVVYGLQRLFGLDADQIFLLTPDQHYGMLADEEVPEFARDRILLYAALSAEAGHVYARLGNRAMARATFANALRFTLRARVGYAMEGTPDYAPKVDDLLAALADEPLDPATQKLVDEHTGR